MKLVIQIPCFNEASTLPLVLRELPQELPGIDAIDVVIIDDGSADETVAVAAACGVQHIVRLGQHKGLARAFSAGVDAALRLGADVIVNTDADNQYDSRDIGALIAPVLRQEADMVVGERHGPGVEGFSPLKRAAQRLGSWVVRQASNTRVPDATSGFRAFSRDAAMRVVVFSDFTYTLETLIHAGNRGLRIAHTPVRTNPGVRPSRLFNGMTTYILRSTATIVRIYAMYQPFRVFWLLALLLFILGFFTAAGAVLRGASTGLSVSVLFAGFLCLMGFQSLIAGVLADLIAGNRRLTEDIQFRIKKAEYSRDPSQAGHAESGR